MSLPLENATNRDAVNAALGITAIGLTTPGTGVTTALSTNTGSAGSFIVNGGALGTPSSGTLTNATGLPVSTGISGLGTGAATALAVNTGSAGAFVVFDGALGTPSSATLTNATGLPISTGVSGLGTGVATALAVNVGSAGAPLVNGGVLGTPSSATLTNATGLPISTGVSGLGTGVATFLATPSSANLATTVTDETGSGALVFGTSPTFTTDIRLGSSNTRLLEDASNIVAQRNSTTAQESRLYNTYTDASNYERAFLRWSGNAFYVGTEAGGTGSNRDIYFSTAGSIRFAIDTSGHLRPQSNGGSDIGTPSFNIRDIYSTGALRIGTGTASKVCRVGGKIKEFYTDAGNTDTSETDLYSYTTEASILANNGETITGEFSGTFVDSAGTATRRVKLYFGGTAIFDSGALTITGASSWVLSFTLIRVSSSVVRYRAVIASGGPSSVFGPTVGELTGLTLSGTNVLKITGTAAGVGAATGDVTAKLGFVSWSPVSV